jgi:hypothetical protein
MLLSTTHLQLSHHVPNDVPQGFGSFPGGGMASGVLVFLFSFYNGPCICAKKEKEKSISETAFHHVQPGLIYHIIYGGT